MHAPRARPLLALLGCCLIACSSGPSTGPRTDAATDATPGADGGTDATPGADAGDAGTSCALPSLPSGALNVRDFGARGDGTTDDTAAIQRAVDAAPAHGTVYVPDGVYMIDAAEPSGDWWRGVALKSDLTFLMADGATLRTIPNASDISAVLVVDSASNVVIAGGTLEGDRDSHRGTEGETGMGVAVVSSTSVSILRTTARNFWGDGFYIAMYAEAWSRDITVCGCLSDNNRRQGLSVTGADGVLIQNSTFSRSHGTAPEYGIDLEPNPERVVKNVRIQGCQLLENRGAGIGLAERSLSNTITGSTFRGNGNGITMIRTELNLIENNLIDQNFGEGIWLLESHRNTFSGNTVSANGLEHSGWHNNIRLDSSNANTLSGNTCRAGMQAIKPAWGIALDEQCHDNIVRDNDLRDGGELGPLSDDGVGTRVMNNQL
jgi:parallel beta-helix repeat protein